MECLKIFKLQVDEEETQVKIFERRKGWPFKDEGREKQEAMLDDRRTAK